MHACSVSAPVTPRRAATVVVIRDAPPGAFEVRLLRRSAAMTFVAGAHVFPGGTVDEADVLVDAAACCDGLDGPPRSQRALTKLLFTPPSNDKSHCKQRPVILVFRLG